MNVPAGPTLLLMLGAAGLFAIALFLLIAGGYSVFRGSADGRWPTSAIGTLLVVGLVVGGLVLAVRFNTQTQGSAIPILGGLTSLLALVIYLGAAVGGGLGGYKIARSAHY